MPTPLLRGALLACGLLALGAGACSNPLANCGLLLVQVFPQDSLALAVGDSAFMSGQVISGCPDKVGPKLDFATLNPAIASIRAVSDTSAWVKGLSAGQTAAVATSRDRNTVKAGVLVNVH